ncbi:LPD7 domain-containing protein [Azohydromonas australica]|uniref:LPD7 domain-containing protein n=1 Tax=Azohydromonas australica TaxID=364039 RepID=UPI000415895D|nr:LPD7 domain-containing protein [Azohydromonas australica]
MDREYELQAQGREPRLYTDAQAAGAAFFAAKREEMPKVLMHEGGVSVHVALTTRDPREPGGYGHLLLSPPDDFKAGYDQGKQAMPAWAVGLHDISPPQPPKGSTVSEQQHNESWRPRMPNHTPAEIAARGVEVGKERGAPLMEIDGKPVAYVQFLQFKDEDFKPPKVEFHAYGPDGNVVREHIGVTRAQLHEMVGERIAKAIIERPDNAGRLYAHELASQLQPSPQVVPAQTKAPEVVPTLTVAPAEASVPPAAPAKPVAPEVVNTIELAVPRVPEPEKPTPAAAPTPQKPDREQLLKSLQERFEVASVGTLLKPADEYRIGGDKGQLRVAFTDHGKRLESRYDAPEVVRGMVDLAQAKGWREIQVAGTLEFQRATWMEGNLRGIHVAGYTPSRQDEERLKAAREQLAQQRQPAQQQPAPEKPANTVEPAKAAQPAKQPEQAATTAAGGSTTTREQFLNMARSVMKDQGYPKDEIDKTVAVMAKRVDGMLARGEPLPKIQVYDKAAPSRAPAPTVVQQPTPQQSPNRGPAPEVAAHAP